MEEKRLMSCTATSTWMFTRRCVFTRQVCVLSPCLLVLQGRLYVGTAEGVAVVPVARCSVYTTCSQCVLARDPLCGWSRSSGVCTGPDDTSDDM